VSELDSEAMPDTRIDRGKLLIGVAISSLALWWVFRSIDLSKLKSAFLQADLILILSAIVIMLFGYLLRAMRWPLFFDQIAPSLKDSWKCLIVGFFMNNVLPARIGEFVRAHLGGRATGLSRSTVLATVAGERLADGLCISLIFAAFFIYSGSLEDSRSAGQIFNVALLFGLAGIATVLVLFQREKFFEQLEKLAQIMPGTFSHYAYEKARKFVDGLEPMLQPLKLIKISIWSLVVWLIELSVYIIISKSFGLEMGLGRAALFMAAVNFSSLIPAAPGGIGVIEALATAALVSVGIERELALSMVVVQHLIQITVVGIPGSYYFFKNFRGKIPAETEKWEGQEAEEISDVSQNIPERVPAGKIEKKKPGSGIWLSVVIPAYNEEERISKTLVSVSDYLNERGGDYEVVVVDDGSLDQTARVVAGFENLNPRVRLLSYGENRGKGFALRFGVKNSKGELVLINDADGASPIEEVERLENALSKGAQVAIGSRAMISRETAVRSVWYRKLLGKAFNGFVNFMVLPGIADTQCGFKLFEREIAQDLFGRQRADGFSFDVEILFLARKAGYKIVEVPINWTNIPGSKVNLLKDSIYMGLDVFKFRVRDWAGVYSKTD